MPKPLNVFQQIDPAKWVGWASANRVRLAVYAVAVGVLLAVFQLYMAPAFLMTLADQLWSCF